MMFRGMRGWPRHGSARVARILSRAAAILPVLAVTPLVSAHAAMHDSETCRRIKAERDTLNGSGIREMMVKGPDWAKTNLTKERMEQIRRFIALEEDMRFRCPLGKARPELEQAESEAGATTALQPGEQAPASKAPPTTKGTGKSKARAEAPASDTAAPAKPPGASKAAAKKKPDAAGVQPSGQVNEAEEGSADAGAEPARKKPR
jgi:hypothetical protein